MITGLIYVGVKFEVGSGGGWKVKTKASSEDSARTVPDFLFPIQGFSTQVWSSETGTGYAISHDIQRPAIKSAICNDLQ